MQTEIRIPEHEYRALINASKRNNKEIDRKAYKIAEQLNKIEVTIDIDDQYEGDRIQVSLDGNIETYCLQSSNYREMPKDLRAAIRTLNKSLTHLVNRKTTNYRAELYRLNKLNNQYFKVLFWSVLANFLLATALIK